MASMRFTPSLVSLLPWLLSIAACTGTNGAGVSPSLDEDTPVVVGASSPDDTADPPRRECANTWFVAYDQCFARAGVTPETPSVDAAAAAERCWQGEAKLAFDACCAANPDGSCLNDGMDWPQFPGAGSCAPDLFAAHDQCMADLGIPAEGPLTDEENIMAGYCWAFFANAAFQRCCAADPIRCDTDDVGVVECSAPGWVSEGTCAASAVRTSERCLADASVSVCDWRAPAQATQTQCWQEGLRARDACCAATPDWSCD
jgi:hypothetical protein